MTHSKLALLSSPKSSSLLASVSSADFSSAFYVFIGFLVIVILLVCILLIVCNWKIFQKAGVPGWAALIPFYNQVKTLEITNRPLWWVLLLFIPFVNIIFLIIVARRLAAVFGKGVGFTWGLVLLPFIFYPILAFGKSVYSNTFPPARPMSEAVKWTLIAGFLFLILETFFLVLSTFGNQQTGPLTVISSDLGYASDSTYVYYSDQPIPGADPSSFKVEGEYGVDDNAVYYEDNVLSGVNPETFRVLGDGDYAVSDTNVYYDGNLVTNADPATFKVLPDDLGYAKDANAVYYNGEEIIGADPATFTLIHDPSGNNMYDAKDKNAYYSLGEPTTRGGTN